MMTKLPAGVKRFWACTAAPNPDASMSGLGWFEDAKSAAEAVEKVIGTHKSGAGCIFELKQLCTIRPMPMDWTRPE